MSSSYDSAVVDTAMIDDSRQLMVGRGTRLLYLEALVWSKVRRTDGFIPTGALAKLTDEPDPQKGAAQLVTVGLWESTPLGWQITDYAETQMTAARVSQLQKAAADRYDKWRSEHPDHPKGKPVQRVGNSASNGPARLPALPPAREEAEGGGGSPLGLEAAAAAPEASSSGMTVACSAYESHRNQHHVLRGEWRCSVCDRRDAAGQIRALPDDLKPRAYKAFRRTWGHLYPTGAA